MPGQTVPATDTAEKVPISVMNDRILESIERGDVKRAQDAAANYTRINLREGSFALQILPPETTTSASTILSASTSRPIPRPSTAPHLTLP